MSDKSSVLDKAYVYTVQEPILHILDFLAEAPHQLQVVPVPSLISIVTGQLYFQIKDNLITVVCLRIAAAALHFTFLKTAFKGQRSRQQLLLAYCPLQSLRLTMWGTLVRFCIATIFFSIFFRRSSYKSAYFLLFFSTSKIFWHMN